MAARRYDIDRDTVLEAGGDVTLSAAQMGKAGRGLEQPRRLRKLAGANPTG